MNVVKREIRQALLGDLVPVEDRLAVTGRKITMFQNGVRDGFGAVFFLGVMSRRRWYKSKKNPEFVREHVHKALQGMGRILWLETCPDSEAVYCAYLMGSPTILVVSRMKDGSYEAAAYSGRSIGGMISVFRIQNKFRDAMADILERLSEDKEFNKISDLKDTEYKEKLHAKEEKKARKKRRKKRGKEKEESKDKE